MTCRDIIKARAISPEVLNAAALEYAARERFVVFTSHHPQAGPGENATSFKSLLRDLDSIGAGRCRLTARVKEPPGLTIPFVCTGDINEFELRPLLQRYGQKNAVFRWVGDKVLFYDPDRGRDHWPMLKDGSFDAGAIASHFGPAFGGSLYFDYPAQHLGHRLYEMAVVQPPPVWTASR
jgi:hypothetical protein